jgi:hypothetical protein
VGELDQSPGGRTFEHFAAGRDTCALGRRETIAQRSLRAGKLGVEPTLVVRLSKDRRRTVADVDEDDRGAEPLGDADGLTGRRCAASGRIYRCDDRRVGSSASCLRYDDAGFMFMSGRWAHGFSFGGFPSVHRGVGSSPSTVLVGSRAANQGEDSFRSRRQSIPPGVRLTSPAQECRESARVCQRLGGGGGRGVERRDARSHEQAAFDDALRQPRFLAAMPTVSDEASSTSSSPSAPV